MKLPHEPISVEEEEINESLSFWTEDTYPILLTMLTILSRDKDKHEEICAYASSVSEGAEKILTYSTGQVLLKSFKEIVKEHGMPMAISSFVAMLLQHRDESNNLASQLDRIHKTLRENGLEEPVQ